MPKRKKQKIEPKIEAPIEPASEPKMEQTIAEAEAKIEPQPDPIVDKYLKLATACRRLPEAQMMPTDRWYGEQFYPHYSGLRNEIRALLE